MNTATVSRGTPPPSTQSSTGTSAVRRFFGVVAQPQSYRNIGYLVLGLPLGTIWFCVLITAVAVGISTLVVALLGIPILLGTWYVTRMFANVERATANVLLGCNLATAPVASNTRGNLWVRLRSMSRDRNRWHEFGFLMARFPAGIATFTVAATALATPVLVAYAPFAARHSDERFGNWRFSSRLEEVATSSPWSWLLVPLGALMLFGSFHLMNVIAAACGRWTTRSLGVDRASESA